MMQELSIPHVSDFTVTGDGSHPAWTATAWQPLTRVGEGRSAYATCAKVLYSDAGLYFLVNCEDATLTCTHSEPFSDLFLEDVVEVFLWPYEPQVVYFEYEISPLNVELPILVTNTGSAFYGWLPFHFTDERQTRKASTVRGGAQTSLAAVDGWTTEFFIPFALLNGLHNVPPTPGTRWRGNIYRIDYDAYPASQWAWSPDTGSNFHNYQGFGTLLFGE